MGTVKVIVAVPAPDIPLVYAAPALATLISKG